jgi:hypothetical protein
MGNRLAPQQEEYEDDEMKKKARERAMMNRLSSMPGQTSS